MYLRQSKIALLFLLLFGFCHNAYAQQSINHATLSGSVADESGAVLAGAAITITNTDTGYQRQVTADSNGQFRYAALPVGLYRIRAEQRGFQPLLREGLQLTVGQALNISLVLSVSALETSIVVSSDQNV